MKIEPKPMTPEELAYLYRMYEATGQVLENSNAARLFAHVAWLTNELRTRNEQIEYLLKAVAE